MKTRKLAFDFFDECFKRIEENQKEKRESWRTMPLKELFALMERAMKRGDMVSVANYAMMLYWRGEQENGRVKL